ncbi:class I SAM-dependent methyltransferase [Roseibium hamelinense]|nr:class I SAM-dependent methyltransferase [Roseibium hamelinense]MTI44472.1 class I SAM-dependent methyltransferase [Roseibium hamelinense]
MSLSSNTANTMTQTTPPRFWDKAARKYAAMPLRNQADYESWLARVVEHLGPDDKVLEVGCGTGSTALRLAPHVGAITATDYAPTMIEIANEKRAQTKLSNLTFRTADPFDPSNEAAKAVGGENFDAVLAFNLLHLLADPENALECLRTLVKPGGLFISKTVCLKDSAWLFAPIIGALRLVGKAPRVRMMSPAGVENIITGAGFEILERQTFGARAKGHFLVARAVE